MQSRFGVPTGCEVTERRGPEPLMCSPGKVSERSLEPRASGGPRRLGRVMTRKDAPLMPQSLVVQHEVRVYLRGTVKPPQAEAGTGGRRTPPTQNVFNVGLPLLNICQRVAVPRARPPEEGDNQGNGELASQSQGAGGLCYFTASVCRAPRDILGRSAHNAAAESVGDTKQGGSRQWLAEQGPVSEERRTAPSCQRKRTQLVGVELHASDGINLSTTTNSSSELTGIMLAYRPQRTVI